jgi:hypothetical protein
LHQMGIHDTLLFRLVSGAGKPVRPGLMRLSLGCEVCRVPGLRDTRTPAPDPLLPGVMLLGSHQMRESRIGCVSCLGGCGGFARVCAGGGAAASG